MITATPANAIATQAKAIRQLEQTSNAVEKMSFDGYMSANNFRVAMSHANQAVTALGSLTNVANPLYGTMTAATTDTLKAIGELRTGYDAVKFIDNGFAQTVQINSIRNALQLLDSASMSARVGTTNP